MRRKPGFRNTTQTALPRPRRRDGNMPEVPTFRPDANAVAKPPASAASAEEDTVGEAVRRMLEAAYT
jgi:hypothetical protein